MSNIDITMRLNGLAAVTQGMGQATTAVAQFQARMASGFNAAWIAAGAAVATATAAMTAGLKNAVDLGGQLNDLSAKLGENIENLIVHRQAFDDAGIGAEAVGFAYVKMQRALEENGEKFKALGLSTAELLALNPAEQFERVARAIGSMPTPTQRTAAAMDLFGRAGADLIPLFRDGGAFENARTVLGDMPAIMARNAATLDAFGDSIGVLKNKAVGFFAGILDQLDEPIKEVTKKLNEIQLTDLGKNIGAFVKVAINEWNAGKFEDFVGLTFEAGIEIGINGAKKWFAIFEANIGSVIVNAGVTGAAALVKILTVPLTLVNTAIILVVDHIREVLQLWGSLFNIVDYNSIQPALSLGDAFTAAADGAGEFRNAITEAANDAKKLLGVTSDTTGQYNEQISAVDRLLAKLREVQGVRDEKEKVDVEMKMTGKRPGPPENDIGIQMREMLEKMDKQLGTFAQKIARTFKSVIGSAVEGVSNGIEGLIRGTMTWGNALQNIGTSILNGVITAISTMFAEWIVQMILVQGLKRLFHSEDKIQAGITTASWAPAAVAANAATGGGIAGIGIPLTLALIIAAVGTIAALAFEHGGITPGRPTLAVVGERGPELVLPAHVTSMLSSSQRAGLVSGNFSAVQGVGSSSNQRPERLIIITDERKGRDLERDQAFNNRVIRINQENRWRSS